MRSAKPGVAKVEGWAFVIPEQEWRRREGVTALPASGWLFGDVEAPAVDHGQASTAAGGEAWDQDQPADMMAGAAATALEAPA